MSKRFKAEVKTIYDFYDKILIKCPRCDEQATIVKKTGENGYLVDEVLSCENCGFIKKGEHIFNEIQPELLLEISCCGNKLWVLNEEHLEYIENFVSAELRERVHDENGWRNQSLSSRLPKWIQSAKNRDEILKAVEKLKKRIGKI